jgi:hypothetical protein
MCLGVFLCNGVMEGVKLAWRGLSLLVEFCQRIFSEFMLQDKCSTVNGNAAALHPFYKIYPITQSELLQTYQ